MEEVILKFGLIRRLKILLGIPVSLFFNKKVEGTFADLNGGIFIEVSDRKKIKNEELTVLFG